MGNERSSLQPESKSTPNFSGSSKDSDLASPEISKEFEDKVSLTVNNEPTNETNEPGGFEISEDVDEDEDGYDEADLVNLLFSDDRDYDVDDIRLDKEEEEQPSQTSLNESVKTEEPQQCKSSKTTAFEDRENSKRPLKAKPTRPQTNKNERKKKKATVKVFSAREVRNEKVIGEGGFGRMLRGSLHGGMPVAIKFFHAPLHIKTLTKEVDSLMCLRHKCIVEVLGIVEQIEAIDCPQVVLQLFPEGNILQYLSRPENPEDMGTLGKFALDIVEGCQYLQYKRIVHGNLAARSVLIEKIIGNKKTFYNAKISDMGIVRFAEASGGNYMKLPGSEKAVPLRWVPKEIVEVQKDGTIGADYTFESDVWSFGVVLWEIWTRGAIPYGASYSNMRVLQFLKENYSPLKVHRPTECHPRVVAIMEAIFQVDPKNRPTFDMLFEQFRFFRGYGLTNKPEANEGLSETFETKIENDTRFFDTSSYPFRSPDFVGTGGDGARKPTLKKKKKKSKNKKFDTQPYNFVGAGAPAETSLSFDRGVSAAVAATTAYLPDGSVPEISNSSYTKKNRDPNAVGTRNSDLLSVEATTSEDPTIAALLYRVNQLEQERNESRRGRGRGKRCPSWDRQSGPPRFNPNYSMGRGDGFVGMSAMDSAGNFSRQPPISRQMRGSSTPLPPPVSQAPPPYTEEPLPHHSLAHPAIGTTSTEYGYNAPGPSRGRPPPPSRLRGRGGGGSGAVETGREDYVRKIRMLAEEIEVLRAEKMTQELLKKSAELADLMKYMTAGTGSRGGGESGRMSSSLDNDSRYSISTPLLRGIPRRRQQYQPGYDFNYNNPSVNDDEWQHDFGQNDESYHNYPPQHQNPGYHQPQTMHNHIPQQQQHQQSTRRSNYGKAPGRGGRGFGKRGKPPSGGSMDYAGSGF